VCRFLHWFCTARGRFPRLKQGCLIGLLALWWSGDPKAQRLERSHVASLARGSFPPECRAADDTRWPGATQTACRGAPMAPAMGSRSIQVVALSAQWPIGSSNSARILRSQRSGQRTTRRCVSGFGFSPLRIAKASCAARFQESQTPLASQSKPVKLQCSNLKGRTNTAAIRRAEANGSSASRAAGD